MKPSSPFYILWLLVLCAGVVACTTEGERRQMAQVIAEADSMNRNYVPMTSDSLLLQACEFYDRHGSPNERMKAHYLLGCVYRDRQQAPEALEQYHKATLCADTTDHGCDFKCLSRIYSQMADLYDVQNMTETTLEMSSRAIYYARKCDDVDAVLALMSNCSACYYRLGEIDSALAVSFRVHDMFCQYHDTLSANTVLGPVIGIYLSQGEFAKVKPLLEKYEHHSFLTGNEHFKEQSYYYLYYYKGVCYTHSEKYDSASYCFRKQISEGTTLDNQKAGNLGLYRLYKKMGITDSISKYADICFSLNDSVASASVHTTLQQMQSLYDYSHHQREARTQAVRAARMHALLMQLLLLFLLVGVASLYGIWIIRYHAAMKIRKMASEYAINMLTYQNLRTELKNQKEKEKVDQSKILQLEREIKNIQGLIALEQGDHKNPDCWGSEAMLLDSPIVGIFHAKAAFGGTITTDNWNDLRSAVKHYIPEFLEALSNFDYKMDLRETNVCILVKLRFSPSEMCNIFQLKPSAIANVRSRLHKHLFGVKGTASEFDERILTLY